MSTVVAPPALQEAIKRSTIAWQADFQSLFHHAKDRFPDVLWELEIDQDETDRTGEEVWGHKGRSQITSFAAAMSTMTIIFPLSHRLCSCTSQLSSALFFFSSCASVFSPPVFFIPDRNHPSSVCPFSFDRSRQPRGFSLSFTISYRISHAIYHTRRSPSSQDIDQPHSLFK